MEDLKIKAIAQAASCLSGGNVESAGQILTETYPFLPVKSGGRNYTVKEMMEQFFRDGFIDRYTGKKLLNPGLLRVLSEKLPDEFPYHPHWKTDKCHMAYWDYQPTVDHIVPVSLGGKDSPENWATTSMVSNSAKGNFTLEQLGWTLKKQGNLSDWDGLSLVFIQLAEQDKSLLKVGRIRDWYVATKEVFCEYELL